MLTKSMLGMSLAAAMATGIVSQALAAGPEVVSGPGVNPTCFAPFSAETKYLKFPQKEPPYRIPTANRLVGQPRRPPQNKTPKAQRRAP